MSQIEKLELKLEEKIVSFNKTLELMEETQTNVPELQAQAAELKEEITILQYFLM